MNLLGSALTSIKPRKDDTLIDRLNYYYSSMIIIGLSITLTQFLAKQYVGQPLQCWVPAEFSKAWEQYAENYCFVHNTYWVKPGEEIPHPVNERVNRQLLYYQWVPFLMALEAGFFYFPILFWAQTNNNSGLNIAAMIVAVEQVRGSGSESPERRKAIVAVSQHLEESVRLRQIRRHSASRMGQFFKMGILSGTFVTKLVIPKYSKYSHFHFCMYILTKLLFILNIIGQFWMMNYFLGQNDPIWGARILSDVIVGRDWELSGNFPRVALCDFTVRTLSNVQRYSIQCVLVLNMFNEKIFLFLYWWFLLVGAMTILDTLNWAWNTRISNRRIFYMKKLVPIIPDEAYLFHEFCDKIIGADGIMLLRMISANSNELFIQEVLRLLWEDYRAEAQLRQVLAQKQQMELAQRRQSLTSRKGGTRKGRPSLIGPNLVSLSSKSSSGNSSEAGHTAQSADGGGWEAESEATIRKQKLGKSKREEDEAAPLMTERERIYHQHQQDSGI